MYRCLQLPSYNFCTKTTTNLCSTYTLLGYEATVGMLRRNVISPKENASPPADDNNVIYLLWSRVLSYVLPLFMLLLL